MIDLSIVIPVYNVASVLPACLDALKAQTRPPEEIIAVDDGSTDDSPAILERYAASMPNLAIVRQENRGRSVARNVGLAKSSGRYVGFVDSDDIPDSWYCQRLLDLALREDLDIALCGGHFHFEGRSPDRPIYTELSDSGITNGRLWLKSRLAKKEFFHVVWLHLYRREFLISRTLTFPANRLYEDVPWTTRALLLADRVHCIPDSLYNYRIAERRPAPESYRRHLEVVIQSTESNARDLESMLPLAENDEELRRLLRWQLVDGALSIFHRLKQLSDSTIAKQHLRRLRTNGFLSLLWRQSTSFAQRRRIARQWLQSL